MKTISILAVCLLAGCVATMPQQSARPTSRDDPSNSCFVGLESDARLQILISKIGAIGKPDRASIEMMASKDFPTEAEKVALSTWGLERRRCSDLGSNFRATYAPPGWTEIHNWQQSSVLQAIAGLYGGSLTYGQFIAERERIAQESIKQFKESNSRNMAARAQQAQQNQERTAAAIQMLMLAQPRPAPMTPSIECTSRVFGNIVRTNCD